MIAYSSIFKTSIELILKDVNILNHELNVYILLSAQR